MYKKLHFNVGKIVVNLILNKQVKYKIKKLLNLSLKKNLALERKNIFKFNDLNRKISSVLENFEFSDRKRPV